MPPQRHCERSEAIQSADQLLDCFVASLLAMMMLAGVVLAPAVAMAQGYPGYPNTIMAPERGAFVSRRTEVSKRTPRAWAARLPRTPAGHHVARRNFATVRGSSGSVLPAPLPRTPLIPPEGSSRATVRITPPEQGPTVVPGLAGPVPNLPHGTESFQDRASRCAFQQGLYNVPGNMNTPYMGACIQ